ncbi:hypothetical protein BOTBODRAFT_44430 [Botryobasidium botryosum FD-172 SS1]|uniref:Uncharacterized protein n=1 Tax=Botryobasidium botryosum (strain FD-172 SS1) TaxID=930990 RepID=A0A067MJQ6_BOTB1|nr:hypothetical protein BOTBODRAFT_44430 [Botryobasidium botryosum FD-172 SS1]
MQSLWDGEHHRKAVHLLPLPPPITSLFDTRTRPGLQFPLTPVFGAGAHADGVGCWVSAGTKIDCTKLLIRDENKVTTVVNGKGALNNLLTLRVLVQNRRRDYSQVLIGGAMARIIGAVNAGERLQKYQVHDSVQLRRMNVLAGITCPYLHVYVDPWGEHRASVLSINGVEYTGNFDSPRSNDTPSAPHLHQIKRPKDAVVALGHGDYAVLELQFLCGDGVNVYFDFQALQLVDGSEDIDRAIGRMPDRGNPTDLSDVLFVPFRRGEIDAYYADIERDGVDAHVRSHYSDRLADISKGNEVSDAVQEWMMKDTKATITSKAHLDRVRELVEKAGFPVDWLDDYLSAPQLF